MALRVLCGTKPFFDGSALRYSQGRQQGAVLLCIAFLQFGISCHGFCWCVKRHTYHVGVDRRRGHVRMTQQPLHRAEITQPLASCNGSAKTRQI